MENYSKFIDAPISYVGTQYTPVSHRAVIETINQYLDKKGYNILKENYNVKSNGQKVVGTLKLESIDSEINRMISWKNSLDGSMSFGVGAGTVVSICMNGMIFSDGFIYKRKHTGNATQEIIESLNYALGSLDNIGISYQAKKEQMKSIPLSLKQMASLSGRMFIQKEILNPTEMSIIKREILDPSYNYNAKNTVWEFYNHVTHALKKRHPLTWHTANQAVGDYINKTFNLN
jgi:hypothetical protein